MKGWKKTKKRARSKSSKAMKKKVKLTRQVARNVLRSTLETKCHNVLQDGVALTSATAAFIYNDLTRVPQGIGDHQRIGDKISGFRLSLKWMFAATTALPQGTGFIRLVLFAAEKDYFDAASDNFILDTSNNPTALSAGNLDDIVAPLNKKDMSVFLDKVYQFGATDSGSRDKQKTGVMSPKLNMTFQYDSNTTEDARKNNMRLLVFIRTSTAASTCLGNLTFRSRFFYKDV